jgi:predicted small lipoprotein YifL
MGCWARNLFIAVVVVLGVGQMVAACGQKGDLYLPPPESEPKAAPQPAEDVPQPEAR